MEPVLPNDMNNVGLRGEMNQVKAGFTLIETIVAMLSLSVFLLVVGQMTNLMGDAVGRAKMQTLAIGIAQQQIELARNMDFADVGTIGGIPPGLLEETKEVIVDATAFTVKTTVLYIDDPFDGLAPVDVLPIDYKRVKVAVSWDGVFSSRTPLELWTDISPKSIEFIEGAGTLLVLVFDASGVPLQDANVHIVADAVNPPVDVTVATNEQGRVLLPGALECVECYRIDVSKEGYTTDRTYGTDEVTNPNRRHVTVQEGLVAEPSFTIDRVATIRLQTVRSSQYNYAPIGAVGLDVVGARNIGTDAFDEPVLAYDERVNTAGYYGEVYLYDMRWDEYSVAVPAGSSVEMVGSDPMSPLLLEPGQLAYMRVVVVGDSPHSLLVSLLDNAGLRVASGSVELTHTLTQAVATVSTKPVGAPDWGFAYFPNLDPVMYSLRALSEGLQEASDSVGISGYVTREYQLQLPE